MLSGKGIAIVDATELAIKTGDVTWVLANLSHQFLNGSATDIMRIFWTDASAEAIRKMLETEETNLIDAEHKA